jgi:anti-sigma factor RsiW
VSHRPSPDDLSAYLDGELAPAEREVVARLLAACPEDAARVATYARLDEALRQGFATPAEDEGAHRLAEAVRARGALRRWRPVAAAAAILLLLVAGAGGWWAHGSLGEPADLADLARDSAATYRVRTLAEAGPQTDPSALASRIGRPVPVPDLGRFGFRLAGSALLSTDRGPALEVDYEDAGGRRIACLFRRRPVTHDERLRVSERDGVTTAYGGDDDLAYTMTARTDPRELRAIAEVAFNETE